MALLSSLAWKSWIESGRQFYPFAAVFFYSSDTITLLTISALFVLYFTLIALKAILFGSGRLRLVEEEHLREWGWMTASESLLAMTVFRNQFDSTFILVFALILSIKAVHWVARDRLDMVEQSIRLPDLYHPRMISTLAFLFVVDLIGMSVCLGNIVKHGPSMAILFASDFTILLITTVSMFCKYSMTLWEQRQRSHHGNENFEVSAFGLDRSTLLFYFDFCIDLCKLSVYIVFFLVIIVLYGLPLHLFRECYLTVASFVKRVQDVIKYRQATENMNARYPDATEEDLTRVHRLCIICREELKLEQVGTANRKPKRLACGHSFHFKCLRSWLERQQSCPTCRRNVFSFEMDGFGASNARADANDTDHANVQDEHNAQGTRIVVAADDDGAGGDAHDESERAVRESIESLKRQMDELQRNVSESNELIRSMSASLSGTSSSYAASPQGTHNYSSSVPTTTLGIGHGNEARAANESISGVDVETAVQGDEPNS